jgi:RNA polymerase sigma-70 factor, ECF subfamily
MQAQTAEDKAAIFQQQRGLLFGIAYRMLGSATDAEDILQEAFLRWLQDPGAPAQSPRAYLTTIVVRLCIDQARSARAQREVYTGPWLPEPLPTGAPAEPADTVILAESLSFAFLVMLERLSPLERAVFLLREVFQYEYSEIAAIVGKSEANCRQILHRAQERLGRRRPRFDVSREQHAAITREFLRASLAGDMQGLLSLLSADIVFTGDGGGKAATALKPVQGPDNVARGSLGSMRRLPAGIEARVEDLNGRPAIVGYLDGRAWGALILDIGAEGVRHVYNVMNPDKLRALRPRPE